MILEPVAGQAKSLAYNPGNARHPSAGERPSNSGLDKFVVMRDLGGLA